jgi:hypothetical protein
MTIKRIALVFIVLVAFSCQDDEKRLEEQQRDAKAKELIFNNINKGWTFATPPLNPKTQSMIANWAELRLFLTELNEKPKSSIGAFQKKAKVLSRKARDLSSNIPPPFNKPQIKARISVLTTKINSINLYINLDAVPDQKVVANVIDANEELGALYRELDEIVRRAEIPKEEGETDMIRMLDTTRAIPNTPPPPMSPMEQIRLNQQREVHKQIVK